MLTERLACVPPRSARPAHLRAHSLHTCHYENQCINRGPPMARQTAVGLRAEVAVDVCDRDLLATHNVLHTGSSTTPTPIRRYRTIAGQDTAARHLRMYKLIFRIPRLYNRTRSTQKIKSHLAHTGIHIEFRVGKTICTQVDSHSSGTRGGQSRRATQLTRQHISERSRIRKRLVAYARSTERDRAGSVKDDRRGSPKRRHFTGFADSTPTSR